MDIYLKDRGLAPHEEKIQTALIQSAIDECAASGGGTVHFPDGLFRAGTIYMRSNVFLHLDPGTYLKASGNLDDYNAPDAWVQNSASEREHTTGGHFIVFLEIENAGITGHGTIDGNGNSFEYNRTKGDFGLIHRDLSIKRPSQMIYMCESRQIRLRDVKLLNSPYWNCFVYGCENVIISGLYIQNDPQVPNRDGIDIDSSKHVVVSDCIIDTEDDCITFRCAGNRLKDPNPMLEDVTVTNCQLRTGGCNAFRIGVGNGVIRNCMVSNIVIRESSKGVCMEARYTFNTDEQPGTLIENVSFDNIFMETRCPVFLASYCKGLNDFIAPPIRNIRFSNMTIIGRHHLVLQANEGSIVEGITLKNIDLQFKAPQKTVEEQYGYGEWEHYTDKNAIYIANVKDALLRDIRIRAEGCSPVENTVTIYNGGDITLENVRGYNEMDALNAPIYKNGTLKKAE